MVREQLRRTTKCHPWPHSKCSRALVALLVPRTALSDFGVFAQGRHSQSDQQPPLGFVPTGASPLLQGEQGPVLLPLLIAGSEHGQDRQAEEGSSFTPTAQMNCRGIK